MKRIFALVVLLMLTASTWAADGKAVSYKSGDETVQGVLYTPSGKGPFPALIVIHEWWGLNDWVKEQASKLSDQGYVALAVDLYRGKVATTPDMAHEIMRGVPEDRAKRDLHAAFEFLASQPTVKKERIGAIGWCMGGGYSLDVALRSPRLRQTSSTTAISRRMPTRCGRSMRLSSDFSAGRTAASPPTMCTNLRQR